MCVCGTYASELFEGDDEMRRLIWLLPVIMLFALPASAQYVPQWELSGGYSHFFANLGNNSFNLHGGTGAIQENVNDWFSGRMEFSGFGGDTSGVHVTAQSYTFGPVFSYRRFERFTPFVHAQLGAMHASAGFLGISESSTKFLAAPGGGVDVGINPRVAVRLQGDYVSTSFLNDHQNNFQFSAQLVIRLGRK
jgi:opacity protein-like surface antigen